MSHGADRTDDADGRAPPFCVFEVFAVKSSISRVAALAISLPLLGCATAQHEATLQGDCDADTMKRRALVARRATLVADMNRDVALGQDGGVPGRSFDDRSTLNADAYVRRVKSNLDGGPTRLYATTCARLDRQRWATGCRAF